MHSTKVVDPILSMLTKHVMEDANAVSG